MVWPRIIYRNSLLLTIRRVHSNALFLTMCMCVFLAHPFFSSQVGCVQKLLLLLLSYSSFPTPPLLPRKKGSTYIIVPPYIKMKGNILLRTTFLSLYS
uniref:Uncharacterized protein n=1 Tax=Astyanax mexicanus TaxID=7994 RepID=A0A3B1IMA8_ASTMX